MSLETKRNSVRLCRRRMPSLCVARQQQAPTNGRHHIHAYVCMYVHSYCVHTYVHARQARYTQSAAHGNKEKRRGDKSANWQAGKARYAGAFAFVLVVTAGDCQALHCRCTVIHMHSIRGNGQRLKTDYICGDTAICKIIHVCTSALVCPAGKTSTQA